MQKIKYITLFILSFLISFSAYADEVKIKFTDSNEDRIKYAFIVNSLANTNEINSHNIGTSGNKVMIHNDLGYEVVLDSKGEIVKDCTNAGSYNFYHPQKEPIKHFALDIFPWITLGACPEYKSTTTQRLDAFLKDYEKGFNIALDPTMVNDLPKNYSTKPAPLLAKARLPLVARLQLRSSLQGLTAM